MSPPARKRDGAFLHLLDERPVRRIGAAQRVDPLAGLVSYQERVDLTVTNGAQRFLCFEQPRTKLFHGEGRKVRRWPVVVHDTYNPRSRPRRTRSVLERSPMM